MPHYDYLIVGFGLFGATFTYRAKQKGKKCLIIDKHIGYQNLDVHTDLLCGF